MIYLPIEIKHRELDSRLLIAKHLLDHGHPVMIGQQWGIFANVKNLVPGVILFKTVNRIQAHNMEAFKRVGHIVAATDEEVLLCTTDACFVTAFDQLAADNCDMFFAQSEAHKTAVAGRFPQLADRIEVTGNPRTDIAEMARLYGLEARKINHENGPFILFNTNFACVNSIWGSQRAVREICRNAGGDLNAFDLDVEWEKENIVAVAHLVQMVALRFPNKIIIRPHPGERIEFWRDMSRGFPQIKIVQDTNPIPWIMAAAVTVHTSCTTGVEAALLDCPAVCLRPSPSPQWPRLTDFVNPCFSSILGAAAAIDAALRGTPVASTDGVSKWLPAQYGAAENIATHLVSLEKHIAHRWLGYEPAVMTDVQRKKCTIDQGTMDAKMTAMWISGSCKQVDESLYVLNP